MRLRRLELANVRGVKDRALVFTRDGATTGVVIVEGSNEAGKSTLGDSLDVLLAYKDSSKHSDVRSLQTTGEDLAPVIEAELQVGAYRFVYTKQFLKQRSTTLHILEPREERLRGDEAHERVERILDEGMDRNLWSSLRLRQGDALRQADLGTATGLANVLAGGGDTGIFGDRELAILEAVREECLRYFTKGGKDSTLLRDARERAEVLQGELEELESQRAAVEADVERADKLERSLPELTAELRAADARAAELVVEARRIDELTRRVEECEHRDETALGRRELLTEQRDRRHALITELAELQADQERLAVARDDAEAARAEAAAQLDEAVTELDAAKARRSAAHAQREQAQRDLAHLQAVADLDALRARTDRVNDASTRLREATATAENVTVDDESLERLRTASTAVIRTEVALDAASPSLRFTAVAPVTVGADETSLDLAAGGSHDWTVRGRLTVRIGDVGQVEVRAGDGTEDADAAHRQAREQLQDLLRAAQVEDLGAAERANRRRLDAERVAQDARRELESALDGRTVEELTSEVERLSALIDRSGDHRTPESPLPADLTDAREALDAATEAATAADREVASPEAAVERARQQREDQQAAAGEARVRVESAAERARTVARELDAARAQVADEVLTAELADAETACATARAELEAAQTALQGAEPETVRSRRENAEAVATDVRRDLETSRQELRDVQVRIEVKGGQGLHERCQAAEAELAHARTELDGLLRRARAAELLRDRLSDHHGRARERYAAPLREQLLAYGRMLYGPDLDVELDDDLRVARRRHEGIWLDVEQLSIGAREQLALLGRVACATLLGDEGGLLMFDDALGNTDPERLERIGAVLREAGEHSQIIVLTCYPDRYRHVGGAMRLAL